MKREVYRRLKREALTFMEEFNNENDVLEGREKPITSIKEAIERYSCDDLIEQIEREVEEDE